MKIHRFFLNNPLGEDLAIKEKQLLHQWNNVLKFKIGENLILFNGKEGFDYVYTIKSIKKEEVKLYLKEKVSNLLQQQEKKIVNLGVSLIKKDNLDLILQKCTEIGVLEFTPIISERVEKKNIASFNKERAEKLIMEATEQSGWGSLPVLNKVENLEKFLIDIENRREIDQVVILDIAEKESEKINNNNKKIYILIGPEGGWTPRERELFKKYKLKIVSFGKNTLRAETAAIVSAFKFGQK